MENNTGNKNKIKMMYTCIEGICQTIMESMGSSGSSTYGISRSFYVKSQLKKYEHEAEMKKLRAKFEELKAQLDKFEDYEVVLPAAPEDDPWLDGIKELTDKYKSYYKRYSMDFDKAEKEQNLQKMKSIVTDDFTNCYHSLIELSEKLKNNMMDSKTLFP